MDDQQQKFDCWALVEVMGHSRYAGRVTEQAIGGSSFVRVDVPAFEGYPAFTKLLGAGSIFAITPVTEQVAKGMAQQFRSKPVNVYDLPESFRQKQLVHEGYVSTIDGDEDDYGDGSDLEP